MFHRRNGNNANIERVTVQHIAGDDQRRAIFIELDGVHFATPRKPPCGCMCPHGPTLFSSYAEKLAEKHALRSCPIGWRPSKSVRPLRSEEHTSELQSHSDL